MKKNVQCFLLLLSFLITCGVAQAQDITVTGTVTAASDKEPLIGVSVSVKGTSIGTATDHDGKYSIKAPQNAVLIINYIGFQVQEIALYGKTSLNVALLDGNQELEEVTVVGYGTQKKKDLTGSIAQIKGDELTKQPVQNAAQAMQGKIAGVQITATGQPNSQPQVRIRGVGSTQAGVNPLYVVDGVLTDNIQNINSSDILSMDVLKDASAAIYGVRAANGVIIVTTKKGKAGKTIISYDGYAGISTPAKLVKMANREQFTRLVRDLEPGSLGLDVAPLTYSGSTDWYDEIFNNAFQMNHNVSVSGGTDKSTFYYSAGYLNQDGILRTNTFKRLALRANNDINISDKFKFTSQLAFTTGKERKADIGAFNSAYKASPWIPGKVQQADGTYRYGTTHSVGFGEADNPLIVGDKLNDGYTSNRLQGNFGLDYKPIANLTLRSAISGDLGFDKALRYEYKFLSIGGKTFLAPGGSQERNQSKLEVKDIRRTGLIWDNTATYAKSINEHSFSVLVGSVTETFNSNEFKNTRQGVPEDPNLWTLDNGDPTLQIETETKPDKYHRQSFVSRGTYAYSSKYLASASLRVDGSSKFPTKWGAFPTVGLGWVMSEEIFLKGKTPFDFLKLRGSYGILGNDNIPSGAYVSVLEPNVSYFFEGNQVLGAYVKERVDKAIKWERTSEFDLGLDFSLLSTRLSGGLDYYSKKTSDALTEVLVPADFGDFDGKILRNAATIQNRGFEFSLNWNDNPTDVFSYHAGVNFTVNKNKVLNLNGGQAIKTEAIRGPYALITDNDQPIASYYLFNAIGVFQNQQEINEFYADQGDRDSVKPGDLKYQDYNGDGRIDDQDRRYFGSYQPKFTMGFNMGFNYKNFDFSTDLYGVFGNKVYNGKKKDRLHALENVEADFADNRWTEQNPSSIHPSKLIANMLPSTYFLESGSFLRMNNLTVGYSLPETLVKRVSFSRLRVYATAQNIFTITKYSGFSPEVSNNTLLNAGVEHSVYPVVRTFVFGLNLSL